MMVKRLDWDSTFFGFEVGVLDNPKMQEVQLSSFEEYKLIYHQSSLKERPKIQGYQRRYSEKKILFSKEVIKRNKKNLSIVHFQKERHSILDLYELAYISGHQSRFYLDKNFHPNAFADLYNTWINKSIDNSIADYVLIHETGGLINGFISAKIDHKTRVIKIGLLGVSRKSQGKGIGSALIEGIENIALENSISCVEVPTQEHNYLACEFYKKKNYLEHKNLYINHYWKNDDTF